MDTRQARRLTAIAAAGLLIGSCAAQRPPDRTPLPAVASAVPEAEACRIWLGTGSGARILEVTAGSAADGRLETGDVVVGVDGTRLESFDEVRDAVLASSVGSHLSLDVLREGRPIEVEVTLQPSGDDPPLPQLGVRGSTVLEESDLPALPSSINEGPLTRTISIAGNLYRYDPPSGMAAALGIETPQEPWTYLGGRLFYVSRSTVPPQLITDGDIEAPAELEVILGVIGDRLLVAVNRDGARSAVLFDPRTGDVGFEIAFEDVLPFLAYQSPDGSRVVIASGTSTSDFGFSLHDARSGRELPADLSVIDNQVVTGWFDNERLLVGITGQGVGLLEPTTGRFESVTINTQFDEDDSVWPVGDGRTALVVVDSDLVLAGVGGDPIEARRIVTGCAVESVGRFGG